MPERILVVDDDPVQRRLIENMVRKFGYEAIVAEGGDQAARILTSDEAARIDCVILDLVMPDLDGFGAARAHAQRRYRDPGNRADRAWRHRQCDLGDAGRRVRLRGQARQSRTAAGVIEERTDAKRARRRIAAHEAQPHRHPDVPRHHYPQHRHGQRAAAGGKGRSIRISRCWSRANPASARK